MTIAAFRLARATFCLCLLATLKVYAQSSGASAQAELNITLGEQRVKFAPTRSFQEMRLEVVNSLGEIIFTYLTADAEYDWNLRSGNGEALAPGLYRYVLALKLGDEVTRQHRGHFIVEEGQGRLWLTAQDGTEVSGTVLNTSRAGGRSIAGVRRAEDGTANRAITDRILATGEKGNEVAAASEAAPLTVIPDDLTVNGNIILTPGVADIRMTGNTGGLRFYGAPSLDFVPQAAAIQFWGNGSGLPGQLYLDTGAHNNAALIFRSTTAGQQILERMRITATGSVGINTNVPSARLEVVKSSAAEDATVTATSYGDDNALVGRSANGTAAAPMATPTGRSLLFLGGRGHTGAGFTFSRAGIHLAASENWTAANNGTRISFETTLNGSTSRQERMRIDHNGNVGIGTTTPGSRLEVAGAIGADFQYNLNGNRILHATGTNNLFAGVNTGLGIITGISNVAFGYEAGRNTSSGNRNTFIGFQAGRNNLDGSNNVFAGHGAGQSNISGNVNVMVGLDAGFNTDIGSNNTFIGNAAGSPNTSGNHNVAVGANTGASNSNGSWNTLIGQGANVGSNGLTYATAIGAGAIVQQSNTIRLGRIGDNVHMSSLDASIIESAFVDTESLDVRGLSEGGQSGHVCYGGETQASIIPCLSTRRMKDEIRSFQAGLSLLQRLRPVTFSWKKTNQPDIGLIAEEVAEVEPLLANYNQKTGEVAGVKYDQITAVLINAVKEQQSQIATQQRQIANLKKQVARIQRKVATRSTMKRTK